MLGALKLACVICAVLASLTCASGFIVASHPFAQDTKEFRVYSFGNSTVSLTGQPFYLDKVSEGRISFIADGKYGLVATDRGKVSIFSLDEQANAVPLYTDYRPKSCYADSVVADPVNATRAYLLDINVSGGICAINIDSNGKVSDQGLVLSIPSAAQLLFPPAAAAAASNDAIVVSLTGVVTLVDWASHTPVFTINAFDTVDREDGSADAVVPSATVTADGKYLLVLDDNAVMGTMRFAALRVNWASRTLERVQVIANSRQVSFADPVCIVASPYNNLALVSSAEGNAILQLRYNPADSATPFVLLGPITITTTKPQLPSTMILLAPGGGKDADAAVGRVIVAELSGIRQLQFMPDGSVVDMGLTDSEYDSASGAGIIGAIGVQ